MDSQNSDTISHIEYTISGNYYITTIDTNYSLLRSNVTGKKHTSYYNKSGKLLWKLTITGSFTYTGTSSKCTSAVASVSNIAKDWSVVSKSGYPSGNSAIGTATMRLKGSQNITKTVKLSCSKNGVLS
ncbi:MAG: hypothetical protein ACLROL_06275 [Sellimonas sp.]|uniref:hypothetical protein n=1 Tax=Sellimonas sp. TaxID=2021466 RepID=UPI0039A27EC6